MTNPPNSSNRSQHASYESFQPEQPSGFLARLSAKVTNCWDSTKGYFTSTFGPSSDAIGSALSQHVQPLSPQLQSAAPQLPAVKEPDSDSSVEEEDSIASTTPTNEAEINGIVMEFFVEDKDGNKIPLSPELLAQLLPILNALAQTPEGKKQLRTGFLCKLHLNNLSHIQFYRNGTEILKGESEKLFKENQDLIQNMQNFKTLLEQKDLKFDRTNAAKADEIGVLDPFVEKVKGDGNCLLHAAAYHIKKRRPAPPDDELKPQTLRQSIANSAQEELDSNNTAPWIKFIAQDIIEAQTFADTNNLKETDPFRQLFETGVEDAATNAASERDSNANLLVTAYKAYVLGNSNTSPTSLGAYAIHYLNEKYFDNKLLIVQKRETNFVPCEVDIITPDINFASDEKLTIPVLLYNGTNHYDAIDSSDPAFWSAYKSS